MALPNVHDDAARSRVNHSKARRVANAGRCTNMVLLFTVRKLPVYVELDWRFVIAVAIAINVL